MPTRLRHRVDGHANPLSKATLPSSSRVDSFPQDSSNIGFISRDKQRFAHDFKISATKKPAQIHHAAR